MRDSSFHTYVAYKPSVVRSFVRLPRLKRAPPRNESGCILVVDDFYVFRELSEIFLKILFPVTAARKTLLKYIKNLTTDLKIIWIIKIII